MKQTLSTIFKTFVAVAALAMIVSVAQAWTPPSGSFPQGNVPAPVNTGSFDQTKNANLGVTKSFFAGDSAYITNIVTANKGRFGCLTGTGSTGCSLEGLVTSPAIFEAAKFALPPSSCHGICFGGPVAGTVVDQNGGTSIGKLQYSSGLGLANGLFVGNDGLPATKNAGFTVDTQNLQGSYGTNALTLNVNSGNNPPWWTGLATIATNVPSLQFWSNDSDSKRTNILANNLDLTGTLRVANAGGTTTPKTGYVLTAKDGDGNADWQPTQAPNLGTATIGTPMVEVVGTNSGFFDGAWTDAWCPKDYQVIGGGGKCVGNINGSKDTLQINVSAPVTYSNGANQQPPSSTNGTVTVLPNGYYNGWEIQCERRPTNGGTTDQAFSYAICMQSTPLATNVATVIPPAAPQVNVPQTPSSAFVISISPKFGTTCDPSWTYTVSASGGVAPYSYSISGAQYVGSNTFEIGGVSHNVQPTTYHVTIKVTDSTGGSKTETLTYTQQQAPGSPTCKE